MKPLYFSFLFALGIQAAPQVTSAPPDTSVCGPANGGKNCRISGFCCSAYGFCGNSNDHCLIEKGCQIQFGGCKSSLNSPVVTANGNANSATTTSSAPSASANPASPGSNPPSSIVGSTSATGSPASSSSIIESSTIGSSSPTVESTDQSATPSSIATENSNGKASQQTPSEAAQQLWLAIAIVVTVILVGLIVAIIIFIRRDRRVEEDDDYGDDERMYINKMDSKDSLSTDTQEAARPSIDARRSHLPGHGPAPLSVVTFKESTMSALSTPSTTTPFLSLKNIDSQYYPGRLDTIKTDKFSTNKESDENQDKYGLPPVNSLVQDGFFEAGAATSSTLMNNPRHHQDTVDPTIMSERSSQVTPTQQSADQKRMGGLFSFFEGSKAIISTAVPPADAHSVDSMTQSSFVVEDADLDESFQEEVERGLGRRRLSSIISSQTSKSIAQAPLHQQYETPFHVPQGLRAVVENSSDLSSSSQLQGIPGDHDQVLDLEEDNRDLGPHYTSFYTEKFGSLPSARYTSS